MAIAQNWHRICRHSARLHAWQISDEQRMMVCHMNHHLLMINVNERDEGEVQNIQLHRLNIQVEIVDWQAVHWLMPFLKAPDIMLALNLSVIV